MPSFRNKLIQNRIIARGIPCAPLAVCADSLSNALALCEAYLFLALFAELIAAFIPKRWPFSLRVVLYSAAGCLVYFPSAIIAEQFFPAFSGSMYLPLLACSLFLTAGLEKNAPKKGKLPEHLTQIVISCALILLFGALRELLGAGSLMTVSVMQDPPLPFLKTASGGLILLVCVAAGIQYMAENRQKGAES